jgi:hypothetical protein
MILYFLTTFFLRAGWFVGAWRAMPSCHTLVIRLILRADCVLCVVYYSLCVVCCVGA